MLDRAREIRVTCDEEYSLAGEFVMGCKALLKQIDDYHSADIDRWHQGHKAAISKRDEWKTQVQQALDLIGGRNGVAIRYKQEQDRLAKEEADRIERERLRQAQEQQLTAAVELEAQGKFEEAQKVIDAPIETPRPTKYISPVPKVEGLWTRGLWKARIVNSRLVKREFCVPDAAIITMHVNKYFPKGTQTEKKTLTDEQRKQLEEEIGGVEVYFEELFAGRLNR